MSIETRTEKIPAIESDATVDKFYLTLVAASGAVRVIELTPALSVRPLDAGLQGQLDRYLELLSTTHATGLRHLTLDALGQGQRELRVSYISEVPVWKSTYRMVFPRVANGSAIVQGWAVVDNTVARIGTMCSCRWWPGRRRALFSRSRSRFIRGGRRFRLLPRWRLTPQTHEAAEMEEPVPSPQSDAAMQPMPTAGRQWLQRQKDELWGCGA